MDDIDALLKRQAEGQRKLRDLSWPEKVRMVEATRESVLTLRRAKATQSGENRTDAPVEECEK